MNVQVETKIEWAGAETYKVWTTLMPLLLDSYAEMYRGDAGEAQDIKMDSFTSPKGRLLVVRIADDIVGMGGWSWVRYLGKADYPEAWWEDTAEIKRVFIRKEFRGRGLGKALNEALIEDAREFGVTRLVAETGEVQVEAIATYHSLGYDRIRPFGAIDTAVESCFFGKDLR